MIHIMIAVRDVKSEAYGRPFFVNSVGVAIRSFDDEVNRPHEENMMYNHPGDFSLYEIGTFDDQTGEVKSMTPKILIEGVQVQKKGPEWVSKV